MDDDERDDIDDIDGDELEPGSGASESTSLAARWTNAVGYACIGLTLMGILLFTASVPRVIDPDNWVCTVSRSAIDDANDDDDSWNDVDLGGAESADDLDCATAESLATQIPTSEDGDDTLVIGSASATRSFGIVAAILGLLQVGSALGTAMTYRRIFRRMAITSAVVGLLAPILGILSLVLIAFIVWALVFSGTAKSIWGEVRFLGGSRRSTSE